MFDPSKMDPKVLMELTQLVQQLPPSQLQRMQSLMHNMMAGFDVQKDMEEFEKSLPPGFREKLAGLMLLSGQPAPPLDVREARLTILRAVASGTMSPEEAEKLL